MNQPVFYIAAILSVLGISAGFGQETPAPAAKAKKTPPPPEALAWMKEVTQVEPGAHGRLAPVQVSYGLSWNNVLNAGEFDVTLNPSAEVPDREWVGLAEGRSNGLARALWPYDVAAQSQVDRRSLRPRLFEVSETERNKTYSYRLEFSPKGVLTRTAMADAKKKEVDPVVTEKNYRFEAVHDVLSAVLYIRSLELAEGDVVKSVVSPFNRPYYTEFEVLGREERKIRGEKYQAIRLGVDIRKINSDRTLQAYDKMKKATIWLSDDEFRLPLEVQADIFVGFISARMTERKWLKEKPKVAAVGSVRSAGSAAE
jgi:hypothetical protein